MMLDSNIYFLLIVFSGIGISVVGFVVGDFLMGKYRKYQANKLKKLRSHYSSIF